MNDVEYLNSSVFCRIGPSAVHGVGVIAIRDIPSGTLLTDYSVHNIKEIRQLCVSEKDFDKILPEIRRLILDRCLFLSFQKKFFFYSPNHDACLTSFMNHSADPNSDGRYALRDIKSGEEVTENYKKIASSYMGEETKLHRFIKKHLQNEGIK